MNDLSPPLSYRPSFSCLIAVPEREAGLELQPEAEGEVPAPPTGQTHRQAPSPTQGPPPPEEGAAGHERGSPQEVRVLFFFFFGAKPLVCAASWKISQMGLPGVTWAPLAFHAHL